MRWLLDSNKAEDQSVFAQDEAILKASIQETEDHEEIKESAYQRLGTKKYSDEPPLLITKQRSTDFGLRINTKICEFG